MYYMYQIYDIIRFIHIIFNVTVAEKKNNKIKFNVTVKLNFILIVLNYIINNII